MTNQNSQGSLDRLTEWILKHPSYTEHELQEAIQSYVDSKVVTELENLPDIIKGTLVSGVAVPRQELEKISLQDLRIVINQIIANARDK